MIEKTNDDKLVFLRKCKYGIFDIDGTLFNSLPNYHEKWCKFWEKLGIEKESLSPKIQKIFLLVEKEIACLDIRLGMLGILIKKIVWRIFDMKKNENPKLFPNVNNLLEILFDKKILFISTASFCANIRLEKAKIKKYFYLALGIDQSPKINHPILFAKFLKISTKQFCASAFMVGDSPQDMKIAKEYSIFAIGVAHSCCAEELFNAGADLVVEKVGDLIEYF